MKKLMALVGLVALPAGMIAQEAAIDPETKFGPYETNRFLDNWFIGIDGGVQTMFGGTNNHGSFSKRLAPVFDLNMGKWMTPNVGIRGVLSLGKIKGYGGEGERWTFGDANLDGHLAKKYNLFRVEANLMYNATNGLFGYRADRVYNLITYAGFGIARSYDTPHRATTPLVAGGLINNFRLTDAWSVNVELKGEITSYYLDRPKISTGKRSAVFPVGLTAGFVYKFKQRNFRRVPQPDYTPYQRKIASLEDDLATLAISNQRLKQELAAEKGKERRIEQEAVCFVPEQAIFFNINRARISRGEINNLKLYAEAIKQEPAKKVYVTGYADYQTGTAAFNQKLSLERAQAVARVLVERFGVDPDQLIVSGGNLENPPFEDTRYNRAVILKMD